MASSVAYNGGPIYSLSSATLGDGATLLNNNFTKLYDMVHPDMSVDSMLVEVPTMYQVSSIYQKATTFALPATTGLNSSSQYIAVYQNGAVRWSAVDTTAGESSCNVPTTSGLGESTYVPVYQNGSVAWTLLDNLGIDGQNGSSVSATSELVNPFQESALRYFYSSGWTSEFDDMSAYRKTYKSASEGGTLNIKVPEFGPWLVNGIILVLQDAVNLGASTSCKLFRITAIGVDDYLVRTVVEACHVKSVGNNTTVDTWEAIDPSDSENLTYSSIVNDMLTISAGTNVTLLYDLTVSGGVSAKISSDVSLVTAWPTA